MSASRISVFTTEAFLACRMSSITVNAPYLHHNVARAFVFYEIHQGYLSLALTLTYVRRLSLTTIDAGAKFGNASKVNY